MTENKFGKRDRHKTMKQATMPRYLIDYEQLYLLDYEEPLKTFKQWSDLFRLGTIQIRENDWKWVKLDAKKIAMSLLKREMIRLL